MTFLTVKLSGIAKENKILLDTWNNLNILIFYVMKTLIIAPVNTINLRYNLESFGSAISQKANIMLARIQSQ